MLREHKRLRLWWDEIIKVFTILRNIIFLYSIMSLIWYVSDLISCKMFSPSFFSLSSLLLTNFSRCVLPSKWVILFLNWHNFFYVLLSIKYVFTRFAIVFVCFLCIYNTPHFLKWRFADKLNKNEHEWAFRSLGFAVRKKKRRGEGEVTFPKLK